MKSPMAVFTLTKNDGVFISLWDAHYKKHLVDADRYILDHQSAGDSAERLQELGQQSKTTVLPVTHQMSFDPHWMVRVVCAFQRFLLESYEVVVFSGADELLCVSPDADVPLFAYLMQHAPCPRVATGYEVVQQLGEEHPLRFIPGNLLRQRTCWVPAARYSKPVASRRPIYWRPGFAQAVNIAPVAYRGPDPNLWLVHLHRVDYATCLERHRERAARPWYPMSGQEKGPYGQNRIEDPETLRRWFVSNSDDTSAFAQFEPIPEAAKALL